jgi:hypothetical protein
MGEFVVQGDIEAIALYALAEDRLNVFRLRNNASTPAERGDVPAFEERSRS